MKTELDALKKHIKKNRRYREAIKQLEERRFNVPFSRLEKELEQLHESRKIARVKVTDPNFGKKFIKATQLEVSARSRMVEMKVMLTNIESNFGKFLENLIDYFTVHYAQRLTLLKTKDERKRFIESVVRELSEYVSKIRTLLELINIYIEDIDKTSYATRNMADTYSVIFRNEGKVVGKM